MTGKYVRTEAENMWKRALILNCGSTPLGNPTAQDNVLVQACCLLQLRILRLGFLQDGDVKVGVFPEGEEVLVGGAGFRLLAGEGVAAP
jgi:hypothetical protein